MAKLTGINGKATGKKGSGVYAVSCGVQIWREYNPSVKNPNTTAQVNQRSKLAMLSGLAAAMAPVLAIPRQGLKSSRNLFIKKNNEYASAVGGTAQISYENLQITNGATSLPAVSITRVADTSVTAKLAASAPIDVTRVVYCIFRKTSEEKLELVTSAVQNTAGENRDFELVLPFFAGELVVYAYGMKDLSANATAKYGSYHVANGVDVANLIATRKLTAADVTLTETRGNTLFSGDNSTVEAGEGQFMVYLTAEGPGSVAAPGLTNGRGAVNAGSTLQLTATPQEGMNFKGWKNNGGSSYLSTSNPYTITVNALCDIVGVFEDPNDGGDGPIGDAE